MSAFCCAATVLQAQQKPQYSQYLANQYIINPAIAGIENYIDAKFSYRRQWVGIDDAPVTSYFTIHGPIGKSDEKVTPNSYDNPGQNTRGVAYWQDYTPSKPHHGWGVQVINDKTGPISNFSAFATYAYHMSLSNGVNLSAGISGGISNYKIDRNKLQFTNQIDPAIGNSGIFNKIRPDLNAGLYMYSNNVFAGLSAMQILPQDIEWQMDTAKKVSGKVVPHWFMHAGYRFNVNDYWNFIPSVLLKKAGPTQVQPEVNLKALYSNMLWAGVGFRSKEGFNAMAGVLVSNRFNVSYSYDYTTSRLNNWSKGSHEVIVGFVLGRMGESCPRNVW